MEKSPTQLTTELSRVRGLGAAHHGVMHWWLQRVTAVAMLPLCLWFISSLVANLLSSNVVKLAEWLASPLHALGLMLLLIAAFVHAKLGLQVIIEDYVKCPVSKYALLLGNVFVCYGALALGILSILKLHWLDVIAAVL